MKKTPVHVRDDAQRETDGVAQRRQAVRSAEIECALAVDATLWIGLSRPQMTDRNRPDVNGIEFQVERCIFEIVLVDEPGGGHDYDRRAFAVARFGGHVDAHGDAAVFRTLNVGVDDGPRASALRFHRTVAVI